MGYLYILETYLGNIATTKVADLMVMDFCIFQRLMGGGGEGKINGHT